MSHHHYISEGDYGVWSGCMVRVPGTPTKLFSYSHYQSVRECRAAAVRWRDMCVAMIGGWNNLPKRGGGHLNLHPAITRPRARNKLGILGVHIDDRIRRQKGRKPYRIRRAVAQLRVNGVVDLRADFPYNRHTKRQAIALAVAARKRFERMRDRLLAKRSRMLGQKLGERKQRERFEAGATFHAR